MTTRRLQSQSGFSLIEVLIVVGIIGILITIGSIGFDMIYGHQLNSAKSKLLADLKRLRVDAVTRSSPCTNPPHNPTHSYSHTQGFGIRFVSETTYRVFEFNDSDGDFSYKADHTEALGSSENILEGGATVTIGDSGSATNNIRIYDKRGILRGGDWSTAASQTYVIRHPKATQAKCIVIDTVTIREGTWNASAATPCQ